VTNGEALNEIARSNSQLGKLGMEQVAEPAQKEPSGPLAEAATFWRAMVLVIATVAVFGTTVVVIVLRGDNEAQFNWVDILYDHFAAIIGLPGAACVAFGIVAFLRQTDGPIEFEGFGFKFKGAAGQVVMWVLCFLAIAGAIKLLW